MSNIVRIKRRASGAAGAPLSLLNAELAYNEVDDVLYYGKGTGGVEGTATVIEAIGGKGAVVLRTGDQTVSGVKTFSSTIMGNIATASRLLTARAITLAGDVTGTVNFDGTGDVSISTTIQPNSVTLGTDTVGNYVAAIGGTTNQITVSGSGTEGAAVVLNLPQDIHSDATPTFTGLNANDGRITNVASPINDSDAATKIYVDSAVQGFDPKASALVATTENITLSGSQTIDGIGVGDGDRVLVKNQTDLTENGIYVASTSGAWVRSADTDTWENIVSAYVMVEEGTTHKESGYLCSVDSGGTLGVDDVVWVQFTGAGQIQAGAGLTKNGNELNVVGSNGIIANPDSIGLTGQALSLHNLATAGLFVRQTGGTIISRSIATSGNGISVANAAGEAGNPTLSLSAALASVGNLTPAANKVAYYTDASTAALADFTAFGRSLIAAANLEAAGVVLGLGTMATQNSTNVTITGGTIDNITIDCGEY